MTLRHLSFAVLLASPMLVSCMGMAAMGAVSGIAEAHDAGNCAQVITEVDQYHSFFTDRPALAAEAFYLKGDCLIRMGQSTEGYGLMQYIAEQHPESPYAYQAKARIDARARNATPD